MTTIREAIEAKKCRKGPAAGTTKSGAFWLPIEPILIRRWGGDGIGANSPQRKCYLELRHYRCGECRAMARIEGWHQNDGERERWHRVDILDCSTVEEVVVILKYGVDGEVAIYSDSYLQELTDALQGLGLVVARPGPDEQ